MIASSFGQYRANHAGLTFPWETGVLADIFGSSSSLSLPQCVGTDMQLLEANMLPEVAQSIGNAIDVLPTDARYTQAVQSLKDVPYFEEKAHKVEFACGVWLDILSTVWLRWTGSWSEELRHYQPRNTFRFRPGCELAVVRALRFMCKKRKIALAFNTTEQSLCDTHQRALAGRTRRAKVGSTGPQANHH